MSDIKVVKDCKLIKVLAAQAKRERVDSAAADEACQIVKELVTDMNPQNRHEIAQTVAYTLNELQQHDLDFLTQIADIKNVAYGDKAAFHVRTGTVKAYYQAKGATTARSYVADKQVLVDTNEISARPALNIVDMREGRINMADLIREANIQMTNMKIMKVEEVLQAAIDDYSSPFYATGTGVVKASLDAQINYFRRLGPVAILGDIAAVSQLTALTGIAMNTGNDVFTQRPEAYLMEANENGYLGKYNTCNVYSLNNAYKPNSTATVLDTNWLYIVPGGMSGDARNLKIVNEGGVNAIDAQNIDDMVYEIRLDQWFGAAFCSGKNPNIGAYNIG